MVGTSSAPATAWHKKQEELWTLVHTVEEFRREVLAADRPVCVDWYAPWCHGCEKAYPEICKVISLDADLRQRIKFVKVCIDDVPKAFAREEGVSALPRMGCYLPGRGRVLVLDVPVSKVKHLRQNLKVMLQHPDSALVVDPNGFVVPTGPAPNGAQLAQAAADKAAAVAALELQSTSIFAKLRHSAGLSSTAPRPSSVSSSSSGGAGSALSGSAETNGSTPSESVADRVAAALAHLPTPTAVLQDGAAASAAPAAASGAAPQQPAATQALDGGTASGDDRCLQAKAAFLASHGHEYGYSGLLDRIYHDEVGVRMAALPPPTPDTTGGSSSSSTAAGTPSAYVARQQHYLDYTGSGVYTQSQLAAAFQELSTTMFGNPHSQNPSSSITTDRIDEVRHRVLSFFNASPADWQLVFTRSATGALKMVGETFPWTRGSTFRYLRENHNSVLGIREYALSHGGTFQAVDEQFVNAWLDDRLGNGTAADCPGQAPPQPGSPAGHPEAGTSPSSAPTASLPTAGSLDASALRSSGAAAEQEPVYSLFAFAGEDNFAGVKYPLSWAGRVKRRSRPDHRWLVLVDAAAYAPTQPLDLSSLEADFVDVAFYKMFGYPTGLGALLVRTEAVPLLRKQYWGGGSVALSSATDNFHVLKCAPSDKLEDGTVSFLDIIALKHGFAHLQRLGGVASIQAHVASLTEWLYRALTQLRHSNGAPMVTVFGKHAHPDARAVQGGIVNFELLAPNRAVISYRLVEREAAAAGFHLRTGAECNPGACYSYLGVAEAELEGLAGLKEGCGDDVEFIRVQRPATPAPPAQVSSAEVLATLASAEKLSLGHPAEVALKWVNVPLGSIRASLGSMSTFEDVWALADWVAATYRDRLPATAPDGSVINLQD